jgi:hypothetical protein
MFRYRTAHQKLDQILANQATMQAAIALIAHTQEKFHMATQANLDALVASTTANTNATAAAAAAVTANTPAAGG